MRRRRALSPAHASSRRPPTRGRPRQPAELPRGRRRVHRGQRARHPPAGVDRRHGRAAGGLRAGQPGPGGGPGRGREVRRGGRLRPLRLPQPDQQRAGLPRRLPRPARRPRPRHHDRHAAARRRGHRARRPATRSSTRTSSSRRSSTPRSRRRSPRPSAASASRADAPRAHDGRVAAALLLAGCGNDDPAADPTERSRRAASPARPHHRRSLAPPPTASILGRRRPRRRRCDCRPKAPRQRDVLAISVDGLNTVPWTGSRSDSAFGRLLGEGAATLNARTEVEQTITLPNHAGMFTGRPDRSDLGGHGVTWNEEVPGLTVPGPDGEGVASVFDVVHDAGGTTALFAGKDKFATFDRTWPEAIDEFEVDRTPMHWSAKRSRTSPPSSGGSRSCTWRCRMSPAMRRGGCRRRTSTRSPRPTGCSASCSTRRRTPRLSKRLVIVLTSDHGGLPGEKATTTRATWRTTGSRSWSGAGDPARRPLRLNPDYADPGTGRPAYDGPQPVRNGDLANLVTELLDLGPVPGSELDADQDLDWRRAGARQALRTPRICSGGTCLTNFARRGRPPSGCGVDRDDVWERSYMPVIRAGRLRGH